MSLSRNPDASPGAERLQSALVVAGLLGLAVLPARAQGVPEYELPPIEYSKTGVTNAVTRLQAALVARPPGAAGSEQAPLRTLLGGLGVPEASQVLVFSKTSLQRGLIERRRPRALYFSDDAYVGWVPGGLMEVAVSDPAIGLAFYRVNARDPAAPPRFERDPDCLSCHGGSMTRNWPGLMVRSVYTDARGEPLTSAGTFLTGHDSPIEERWGGWYVTGQHGAARHLGNITATLAGNDAIVDREAGANRGALSEFFDPAPYLRADSDIVALLVFEHQVGMMNRLVEGGLRVRKWMAYQQNLQRELKQPVSDEPSGTARRVVEGEATRIVEHLMFCDEAPLPDGGVRGAGDFERAFRENRRPDARGRSLKDFDLKARLFTWRCSYLIHSEAFRALPEPLRKTVARKLGEVLLPAEPPARFRHLPVEERQAIREILAATEPAITAEWR